MPCDRMYKPLKSGSDLKFHRISRCPKINEQLLNAIRDRARAHMISGKKAFATFDSDTTRFTNTNSFSVDKFVSIENI